MKVLRYGGQVSDIPYARLMRDGTHFSGSVSVYPEPPVPIIVHTLYPHLPIGWQIATIVYDATELRSSMVVTDWRPWQVSGDYAWQNAGMDAAKLEQLAAEAISLLVERTSVLGVSLGAILPREGEGMPVDTIAGYAAVVFVRLDVPSLYLDAADPKEPDWKELAKAAEKRVKKAAVMVVPKLAAIDGAEEWKP